MEQGGSGGGDGSSTNEDKTPQFNWSQENILFLLQSIEIHRSTNALGSSLAWYEITNTFRQLSYCRCDTLVLKHKYDNLRTSWRLWREFRDSSPDVYIDNNGLVFATPEWWAAKLKENRRFRRFNPSGFNSLTSSLMDSVYGSSSRSNTIAQFQPQFHPPVDPSPYNLFDNPPPGIPPPMTHSAYNIFDDAQPAIPTPKNPSAYNLYDNPPPGIPPAIPAPQVFLPYPIDNVPLPFPMSHDELHAQYVEMSKFNRLAIAEEEEDETGPDGDDEDVDGDPKTPPTVLSLHLGSGSTSSGYHRRPQPKGKGKGIMAFNHNHKSSMITKRKGTCSNYGNLTSSGSTASSGLSAHAVIEMLDSMVTDGMMLSAGKLYCFACSFTRSNQNRVLFLGLKNHEHRRAWLLYEYRKAHNNKYPDDEP